MPIAEGRERVSLGSITIAAVSRALRIIVEYRRVLDQDAVADLPVGRPHEEEIKQQHIVRLLFRRMGPVAAPYATFRCRFRIGLSDRGWNRAREGPKVGQQQQAVI